MSKKKSEMKDSLLLEQFRALAAQRADLEKHIWQIPLAVVTGVAVMFGATSRLLPNLEYGIRVLIIPSLAGIAILVYGIIVLCRMRVGRELREKQLKKILENLRTKHYLVNLEMLNDLTHGHKKPTYRLGRLSQSVLSIWLLGIITLVLVVLLFYLALPKSGTISNEPGNAPPRSNGTAQKRPALLERPSHKSNVSP